MELDPNLNNQEQQLRWHSHELFPTTVMRFDTAGFFSPQDIADMKTDIDELVSKKQWLQINDLTPRWQSMPVLWNPGLGLSPSWQRLQEAFTMVCGIYAQSVPDFVKNVDALEVTGSRAWFYKHDPEQTSAESNPWHNHTPALLSGIFYLDADAHDNQTINGTEFRDPRGAGSSVYRDAALPPQPQGWMIFPGWMEHKTGILEQHKSRYVVAADLYVKVRHEISAQQS